MGFNYLKKLYSQFEEKNPTQHCAEKRPLPYLEALPIVLYTSISSHVTNKNVPLSRSTFKFSLIL